MERARHRREPPGPRPRRQPARGARAGVRRQRLMRPTPPAAALIVLSGPVRGRQEHGRRRSCAPQHPEVWLSVSATTRPAARGDRRRALPLRRPARSSPSWSPSGELLEWAEFAGQPLRHPARSRCRSTSPPARPCCSRSSCRAPGRSGAPMPEALLVFLAPPSWDELVRRLTGRGTEAAEVDRAPAGRGPGRAGRRARVRRHAGQHDVEDVVGRLVALMRLRPTADLRTRRSDATPTARSTGRSPRVRHRRRA